MELKYNQEELFQLFKRDREIVTNLIKEQDTDGFIALLDYFESDEGRLSFKYFSDMQKINVVAAMINLEVRNNAVSCSFLFGTNSFDDLLEKYNRTIFYLRRIEMGYGEECKEEISSFFQGYSISCYAVYFLCHNEVLLQKRQIACGLYYLLGAAQDNLTVKLLQLYDNDNDNVIDNQVYYCLADYCLEKGYLDTALLYLKKIKNPDEGTVELIQDLQEVIRNG